MVFRVVAVVITLALMGVLASSLRGRLNAGGANSKASTPNLLLQDAGMVLDRTHELTGKYSGITLQDAQGLRLVSVTPTGYCLQLMWLNQQPYHLRGPGGTPAPGPC